MLEDRDLFKAWTRLVSIELNFEDKKLTSIENNFKDKIFLKQVKYKNFQIISLNLISIRVISNILINILQLRLTILKKITRSISL